MSDEVVVIEELRDLAAKAAGGKRLSPADEDSGAAKLRELLQGEKPTFEDAAALVARLPWIIVTRAIPPIWEEMKPTQKRFILNALAEDQSDSVRRIRISLARAMIQVDPPTSLKLVVSTAREAIESAGGVLPPPVRQAFAQVFVGKGKPYFAQLDPAELKNPDASALAQAALAATFPAKTTPRTQMLVLEWMARTGLLTKLKPEDCVDAVKIIRKWSSSLRAAVSKLEGLPEVLAEAVKPRTDAREGSASEDAAEEEREGSEERAEAPEGEGAESGEPTSEASEETVENGVENDVEDGEPVEPAEGEAVSESDADDEDSDEDAETKPDERGERTEQQGGRDRGRRDRRDDDRRGDRGRRPERGGRQDRSEDRPGRGSNAGRLIEQLGAEFEALQKEVTVLRGQLRVREEASRRARRPEVRVDSEPNEDLKARNAQLEATVELLKSQLEELTAQHEDMALSMGAGTDEPNLDPKAQLLSFLGIRLSEDHSTFQLLKEEPDTEVLRNHYKDVLANVFELLESQGVKFVPPVAEH